MGAPGTTGCAAERDRRAENCRERDINGSGEEAVLLMFGRFYRDSMGNGGSPVTIGEAILRSEGHSSGAEPDGRVM